MEEIIGRRFVSDSVGVKDADGLWTATLTIKEYKTVDGENWEVVELSSMGIDNTLDAAYNTAWKSLAEKFKDGLTNGSGDSLFKE